MGLMVDCPRDLQEPLRGCLSDENGHRCSGADPRRIGIFCGPVPTARGAARTFLSWPHGPIGCFQFSVGALLKGSSSLRHTGFSLVRESGMNRDEGIAERTDRREGGRRKSDETGTKERGA